MSTNSKCSPGAKLTAYSNVISELHANLHLSNQNQKLLLTPQYS